MRFQYRRDERVICQRQKTQPERHHALLFLSPAAMTLVRLILICAMLGFTCAQPSKAEDTIDRPVTIYVAGTAGGGIDLYARLVSRHIGRHIPGKPAVSVQVMPGAGGIRAANYLAEQAPRDGTAMTTFAGGPILEPLIGARNPGYDMSSFTWIGAITKDMGLCIAWGATPFKTIDDVKRQQMVVAGTGAGSETDTWPVVLNDVLGTKFKRVTGERTQSTANSPRALPLRAAQPRRRIARAPARSIPAACTLSTSVHARSERPRASPA